MSCAVPSVASRISDLRALADACLSTTGAAVWRTRGALIPLGWQLDLGDVCDRLIDSALEGTGLRATISAPPRHGKTEWTGRGLPIRAYLEAYRRGLCRLDSEDPAFTVLYVTASDRRARSVSDQIRAAVERIYRETGDELWAPGALWTRQDWQTRGGLRWVAVGWREATGGVGASILVMDDMIGSSQVYRSPSSMEQLRRVVQEDLLSRLMDGGAALQMETRRGIRDTTAWLGEEYGEVWGSHVWPCHTEERGYLWPAVYGEAWRATMPHLTDASPVWRSLYQQEPIPEGGTVIPAEWLEATYSEDPRIAARLCDRRIIGVDLASTGQQRSDPCAFVVIGVRGAFHDVLFSHQSQMDYPSARQYLAELATEWGADGVTVERAAGGDAMIADLQSIVRGISGYSPRGDKVTRITPYLPLMAARQVRLPSAPGVRWVRQYREVMTAFSGTAGEDDHLLDATTCAMVGCDTGPPSLSADEWTAFSRMV